MVEVPVFTSELTAGPPSTKNTALPARRYLRFSPASPPGFSLGVPNRQGERPNHQSTQSGRPVPASIPRYACHNGGFFNGNAGDRTAGSKYRQDI
jgi:hypothetical protein